MITIAKRTYTTDQAKRLLATTGWVDDVNAFIASLPEHEWYGTLNAFKQAFRDYRTRQRLLLASKAVEVVLPKLAME